MSRSISMASFNRLDSFRYYDVGSVFPRTSGFNVQSVGWSRKRERGDDGFDLLATAD